MGKTVQEIFVEGFYQSLEEAEVKFILGWRKNKGNYIQDETNTGEVAPSDVISRTSNMDDDY